MQCRLHCMCRVGIFTMPAVGPWSLDIVVVTRAFQRPILKLAGWNGH